VNVLTVKRSNKIPPKFGEYHVGMVIIFVFEVLDRFNDGGPRVKIRFCDQLFQHPAHVAYRFDHLFEKVIEYFVFRHEEPADRVDTHTLNLSKSKDDKPLARQEK